MSPADTPMLAVHRATLADLDALAPLFDGYRQFYGRAPELGVAREFLRERIERGESAVFLATLDGAAVGFTQLYPSFSSVSAAPIQVLNDLFVSAEGRRHGVGRALLAAAIEFARAQGAVRVVLSTAHTNTSAQALYESTGWALDRDYRVYEFPLR